MEFRDNLPKTKFNEKIKEGAYVINRDDYFDFGTHWIALYALNNNITYFDVFGVERIPKEIKKFVDKSTVVITLLIFFSPNNFKKKR